MRLFCLQIPLRFHHKTFLLTNDKVSAAAFRLFSILFFRNENKKHISNFWFSAHFGFSFIATQIIFLTCKQTTMFEIVTDIFDCILFFSEWIASIRFGKMWMWVELKNGKYFVNVNHLSHLYSWDLSFTDSLFVICHQPVSLSLR